MGLECLIAQSSPVHTHHKQLDVFIHANDVNRARVECNTLTHTYGWNKENEKKRKNNNKPCGWWHEKRGIEGERRGHLGNGNPSSSFQSAGLGFRLPSRHTTAAADGVCPALLCCFASVFLNFISFQLLLSCSA